MHGGDFMEKPLPGYGKIIMPENKQRKIKSRLKRPTMDLSMKGNATFLKYIKKFPLILIGYFSGTFSVFGGFNPIGLACISAFFGEGATFYAILLAAFIGYIRTSVFGVPMYAVAICFCALSKFFIFTERKRYGPYQGLVGAICLLTGAIIFSIMNGGSKFILFRGITESICVFGLSEIIRRSIYIYEGGISKKILGQEDIFCLGIVFVLMLCVISLRGKWGFELSLLLGTTFLLVLSYKTGTQSVAVGAVLGMFFLLLQTGTKELFLMLCIASVLAGVFNKRRIYSVIAFWTGFIVPAFYLNTLPDKNMIFACGIGSFLFLLMPEKALNLINTYQYYKKEFYNNDYYVKFKEIMEEKLDNFATAFGSLASTFEVVDVPTEVTPKDASEIVDKISKKVCSSCEMSLYCWRAKNYETYEGIHRLIGAVEKNGEAEKKDFTPWLKESCVCQKEIVETANFYGREYKNNLVWKNRINQSRGLIKEQLLCVEKVLGNLSSYDMPQPTFYESMSNEIKEKLIKKGMNIKKVYVTSVGREGMSVSITKESCLGNNQCKSIVLLTVNSVTGKSFSLPKTTCIADKNGDCQLTFKEQKGYNFKTAVAAVTKEGSEKSGDTYYSEETEDKKGILALCDGMGTGNEASRESGKAVGLIKKFLHAGFPLELTMKTLNSVLAVENKEIYTTMDVCSVDLYSGATEIIKNGGSTVFVLKGGKIKTIRSSSLPMGIFKDWDGEVTKLNVDKGDYIVMVTDGITESFGIEHEKEAVIEAFKNCEGFVESFAVGLLNLALSKYGGKAKDDMTVLVGKIS